MTTYKKKKKVARIKTQGDHGTKGYVERDLSTIKSRKTTLGIQIFGGFLAICLGIVGFAIGMLVFTIALKIFSSIGLPYLSIPIGMGACLCLFISPLLRYSCYRIKRKHLQRHGVRAQATIVGRNEWMSSRGLEQYDFVIFWQHPETEQICQYDCHYTFSLGVWRAWKNDLLREYYAGAYISVVFNPKHPRYFALEIPFTPCWFDTLF